MNTLLVVLGTLCRLFVMVSGIVFAAITIRYWQSLRHDPSPEAKGRAALSAALLWITFGTIIGVGYRLVRQQPLGVGLPFIAIGFGYGVYAMTRLMNIKLWDRPSSRS